MNASIEIGALPGERLNGQVSELALRSKEMNNASVFDLRIELDTDVPFTLRSGYSAVAEIEVDRRANVLTIPERVVKFDGADANVLRANDGGEPVEHQVQLGLSDGLTIEILEGLEEGDQVFERH